MTNKYSYSPEGGYIRVNKRRATRLFAAGVCLRLTPCKVAPTNKWGIWLDVGRRDNLKFENVVHAYEYYNCNNALGRYAAYWVDANWGGF